MKLVLEYIKYRWKAKRRHGIHSPFVRDLCDECLSTAVSPAHQDILNDLFLKLQNDDRLIEISDFGAGSKRLGSQRKVSKIFNTSSSKGKYGKLLYQLAQHYQPKKILEFGTSLGVGTHYLHLGNTTSHITTIEACHNTRSIALENLPATIESIQSTFSEHIPHLQDSFDLVFIDGHHDGDALLQYLKDLDHLTHDDTLFILDDIRWSQSMLNAWNRIIQNEKYTLTLDFFRVGVIAKKSAETKEHFILKM